MKIKLEKILVTGIILQILATQGILTFNIFKIFGYWELKSILHPIAFALAFLYFILKMTRKIKMTEIEALMFVYLTFCFFILLHNTFSPPSIFLSFREIFLLFLLVYIYNQTNISTKNWEIILKLIYYLILANLFFVLLTYYLGPVDYMKFVTGRFIWNHDPLYKFKITNFHQFWRSPALVGSGGTLGYFALLAFMLFDVDPRYKRKKYFALLLVCLCFIRSVYLALVIYLFFKFFVKKKNLKRLVLFVKFGTPLLLALGVYLYNKNIFSIKSVFMRIDNWFQNIDAEYNIFFGGAIGKLGAAARGQGFIATMDSYWIYMFLTTGVIGLALTILFFYEKTFKNNSLIIVCIAMALAGLFVSFNQSIPFLVLFPLFFLKRDETQYST